jgi:hypothetical protein
LHVNDIRGVMGEITSYYEKDLLFPFFWFLWVVLWHFLGLHFLSFLWWFQPSIFYWIFVTLLFCDRKNAKKKR